MKKLIDLSHTIGDGLITYKHLLDLAKEGCDTITVWAYEKNIKARKFYRREGFIEVSREFDENVNLMDVEHHWKR